MTSFHGCYKSLMGEFLLGSVMGVLDCVPQVVPGTLKCYRLSILSVPVSVPSISQVSFFFFESFK